MKQDSGNGEKGSKAGCLAMTGGENDEVAERLTRLSGGACIVKADDFWMPKGIDQPGEARLDETPELFPGRPEVCDTLKSWWLKVARNANTPNWDIASTCEVQGQKGLLLVEAKAHLEELKKELKGKPFEVKPSENHRLNHKQIGQAISDASADLQFATGWKWAISRDRCYQMSNRFALAWKVASLNIPVVLVYLGFLNADEMSKPFTSEAAWADAVLQHSAGLVPKQAWGNRMDIQGTLLQAEIQVVEIAT